MLDENIVALSPSTVYRILDDEGLIVKWKEIVRGRSEVFRPKSPDQQWQTDITYIRVGGRQYYPITFIDIFSRYITYWELFSTMDRHATCDLARCGDRPRSSPRR